MTRQSFVQRGRLDGRNRGGGEQVRHICKILQCIPALPEAADRTAGADDLDGAAKVTELAPALRCSHSSLSSRHNVSATCSRILSSANDRSISCSTGARQFGHILEVGLS